MGKYFTSKFIPTVPRKYLMLIAGIVWSIAGSILLFKSYKFMNFEVKYIFIYLFICVLTGLLFFYFLFSKISKRHIDRLNGFRNERYSIFSFFNLRSYLLMFGMISMGIIIRKLQLVQNQTLAYVYLTMGIPLLISSFRFYLTGLRDFFA
ncbi:MAG: hypothetical protein ACOYN5_09970 [Bacteroidales bacterium]